MLLLLKVFKLLCVQVNVRGGGLRLELIWGAFAPLRVHTRRIQLLDSKAPVGLGTRRIVDDYIMLVGSVTISATHHLLHSKLMILL